ncbi:MAG TPA: mandelate racemase/muconate lactonizing enzyme family protein [Paraburkholderia sp.]
MKITRLRTQVVHLPIDPPILTANLGSIVSADGVLTYLETDDGLVGEGLVLTINNRRTGVIHEMIRNLEDLVVGLDPNFGGGLNARAWKELNFLGYEGVSIIGLAAIDNALWDLRGKAAGLNVAHLIGACRAAVPCYASGGLWLSGSIDDLQKQASRFVNRGFRAMKTRVGPREPERMIARVRAIREAVGPDVALMVDANHCFNVPQAINIGRELEKLGVHWFEEPISPEDLDGYVEVSRRLDMAVAGGENEFTKFGFRRIIEKRAMDVVQPDVCAAGGITECKKIATLAQASSIQCVPHAWGTAIGLAATMQFLASLPFTPPCLVPTPPMLEYEQTFNPFRDELSSGDFSHREGLVKVPDGPGLGIEIDRAVLKRYRVA